MRNISAELEDKEYADFIELCDQLYDAQDEGIKCDAVIITFKELSEMGAILFGTSDKPAFTEVAKEFPDTEVAAVLQYSEGDPEISSSYINVKTQEEGERIQNLIDNGGGYFRCDTIVPGHWTLFERE